MPPPPPPFGYGYGGIAPAGVHTAGNWARIGARILDGLILGIPVAIAASFLTIGLGGHITVRSGSIRTVSTAFSLAVSLIVFVIEVLFLVKRGATPGKSLVGIQVEGSGPLGRPTPKEAIIRTGFSDVVGLIPIVGPVASIFLVAFHVHDRVAKTTELRG